MKFDRCFGCMEEIQGYPCPQCGFDPAQAAAPNYVLPYGAILNGRYIVGKMLGRGGFGITYIGFDLMLQRKVAVKEYFPSGQVSRISPISTELQWLDGEGKRCPCLPPGSPEDGKDRGYPGSRPGSGLLSGK